MVPIDPCVLCLDPWYGQGIFVLVAPLLYIFTTFQITFIRYLGRTSGLVANPSKCKVFFSGVSEEDVHTLAGILGFDLGMPLHSSKPRVLEYGPLLSKIIAVIHFSGACTLMKGGLRSFVP